MSKRILILMWTAVAACMFVSCSLEPADDTDTPSETVNGDKLLVLCEGLWGMDNSTISYFSDGT